MSTSSGDQSVAEPARLKPRVVVVGAGIAGLSAAARLADDGRAEIVVLDGAPQVGGKLRSGEVAGVATDLGAEAILARRPEGVALLGELGLGDQVVHPATTQAGIWSRGAVRPLPAGQVMGIPTSIRALAASGVVSTAAVARAALDEVLPPTASGLESGADVSVGSYVGRRMGRAVVDRLVEPLLGGVYAGRADELSLRATLPQVAEVAATSRSLLRGLQSRPAPAAAPGPVFAGLPGGVGRLVTTLEARIGGAARVRSGAPVRELHRTPAGWRLVVGSAASPELIDADAVVLAVPGAPAARLLGGVAPAAAVELNAIEYASMAVVTLAFAASAFEKPLFGSGFLVPAVERRLVKAVTFSSAKWGWYADLAPDLVIVRCSIGRYRDVAELQRDDDELIAAAVRDLAAAIGVRGVPRDALVTRWGGALPQYTVGHLDRVARIKAAVGGVPGLAVCGAAYDGVGIPACIASGQAAATRALRDLFGEGQ